MEFGEETNIELSITAQFSEQVEDKDSKKSDVLKDIKEVKAKLVFTKEQEMDLEEAFNLLDYTGEGKIKADDFRVIIKALGYEPTKEDLHLMVSAVDKGATGKLSYENFRTAIMRKVMSLDTDVDIMKSFRLFDVDDTGKILSEHLKLITQIIGYYLTDEEIEEMIDDADTNQDGFVNEIEFFKLIKNSVLIVTP